MVRCRGSPCSARHSATANRRQACRHSGVARHDSFEGAVLQAANLGDDADTTAAITGQLAGALHGASGIADRWLERLHLAPEITALADALWQAARGARDASQYDSRKYHAIVLLNF